MQSVKKRRGGEKGEGSRAELPVESVPPGAKPTGVLGSASQTSTRAGISTKQSQI